MGRDTDFNPKEFDEPTPWEDCMERIECSRCGKFHGYCKEINKTENQGENMLPQDGQSAPQGKGRKRGGLEYLTTEHLSKTPKEAKILAVKYEPEGRFGPRVVIKVSFEGGIKFWSVPTTKDRSPNYRLLLDQFGPDENDWVNEKILIGLEQDEFTDQYFPRVQFPTEVSDAKDKRKR